MFQQLETYLTFVKQVLKGYNMLYNCKANERI